MNRNFNLDSVIFCLKDFIDTSEDSKTLPINRQLAQLELYRLDRIDASYVSEYFSFLVSEPDLYKNQIRQMKRESFPSKKTFIEAAKTLDAMELQDLEFVILEKSLRKRLNNYTPFIEIASEIVLRFQDFQGVKQADYEKTGLVKHSQELYSIVKALDSLLDCNSKQAEESILDRILKLRPLDSFNSAVQEIMDKRYEAIEELIIKLHTVHALKEFL